MSSRAIPALLLVCACSGGLPHPAYIQQPTDALAPVGFPPPPARVERVPPQPAAEAVWIDGEWTWLGAKWAWKRGRWVAPRPDALFSPWTMTRDATGAVYFASGTWRDPHGAVIAEPATLAEAKPDVGPVVDDEGNTEETGKTIRVLPPANAAAERDGGA